MARRTRAFSFRYPASANPLSESAVGLRAQASTPIMANTRSQEMSPASPSRKTRKMPGVPPLFMPPPPPMPEDEPVRNPGIPDCCAPEEDCRGPWPEEGIMPGNPPGPPEVLPDAPGLPPGPDTVEPADPASPGAPIMPLPDSWPGYPPDKPTGPPLP